MTLGPTYHFTEFNITMWSLSFSRSILIVELLIIDLNKEMKCYYAQAVLIANTKIRRVKKTWYLLK